jgi:hypothetical protein
MNGDHGPGPSRALVAAGLETHFALVQDTSVFRAERIAQHKWWTDHIAALVGQTAHAKQTQAQRIAFEGKAAYLAAYKKDTQAMERSLLFFAHTHCNGQGRCTCGKSIMWTDDTQDLHRCNLARREQAYRNVTLYNEDEAHATSAQKASARQLWLGLSGQGEFVGAGLVSQALIQVAPASGTGVVVVAAGATAASSSAEVSTSVTPPSTTTATGSFGSRLLGLFF